MVFKYVNEQKVDIIQENLELEKSLGYKRELTIEKAEHKKPAQHQRHLRSGKIVTAGHGTAKNAPKELSSDDKVDYVIESAILHEDEKLIDRLVTLYSRSDNLRRLLRKEGLHLTPDEGADNNYKLYRRITELALSNGDPVVKGIIADHVKHGEEAGLFRDEDDLEKAVSVKPISRHQRMRSGKPYFAGHGMTRAPRGAKEAPVIEEESPEEVAEAERETVNRYMQTNPEWNEKSLFIKSSSIVKALPKAKQALASTNIAEHMHHLKKHPGGREQAIAIGIAQAKKGEKENLEKTRTSGAKDKQKRKQRAWPQGIEQYPELKRSGIKQLDEVKQEAIDDYKAGNMDKKTAKEKIQLINKLIVRQI